MSSHDDEAKAAAERLVEQLDRIENLPGGKPAVQALREAVEEAVHFCGYKAAGKIVAGWPLREVVKQWQGEKA